MSSLPHLRITEEEYLALERAAEFKSEYFDGQIVAMSGASRWHVAVTQNIARQLGNRLEQEPCDVGTNDMKVRVSHRSYMYPDVVITCGEPRFADDEQDVLLNPQVLIEILFPSTERYDRGLKAAHYRTIPSLQQYVLVWQTEPRIEILTKQTSGDWLLHEVVGIDSICPFESLKCEVPMNEIYRRIRFDPLE